MRITILAVAALILAGCTAPASEHEEPDQTLYRGHDEPCHAGDERKPRSAAEWEWHANEDPDNPLDLEGKPHRVGPPNYTRGQIKANTRGVYVRKEWLCVSPE